MSTLTSHVLKLLRSKNRSVRNKRPSRNRSTLRLEALESRQLLAADVSPFVPMGEIGVGGRIDSISVQPGNSNRVLVGGDMLGVGVTVDGGQSWRGTHDGWLNYNASDFTWDSNNPGHVWAGTLGGPHFSDDYGQTWQPRRAGLPSQQAFSYAAPIEKILIDPLNPQRLLAFEGDHRFILNNRPFVFSGNVRISINGGQSWNEALTANIGTNSNIVDAEFATDTRVVLVARDDAIYISDASGTAGTWQRRSFNLPGVTDASATSIAVDPTNSNRMWVTLFGHGVIRSIDAGQSWQMVGVGELPTAHRAGYYILEPAVDAAGNVTLFVGNASNNGGNGIFRSTDAGETWTRIAGNNDEFGNPNPVVNGEIHAAGIGAFWIEVDPNDPQTIWSGTSSRVIRSVDGGDTWVDMMNDNGAVDGTYRGRGYTGWVAYNAEFNPFHTSQIVLQGMDSAKLLISEDGGDSWRLERDGLNTPYRAGTDIVYFSRDIAYATFGQWGAEQVVARTTDGGQTWTQLNLTGVSFGRPDGTTANEFRAVHVDAQDESRVWALATSGLFYTTNANDPANSTWKRIDLAGTPLNMVADPFDNDGLYVMTSVGMYHTFDGVHYDYLTGSPQHTTNNRRFIGLEADPNQNGVVYLANEDSGQLANNGLWRFEGILRDTVNDVPYQHSASNWTRLGVSSWGNAANRWIRAVAVDPTDSNRIVVGTNKDPFADTIEATGVWFSEDAGQSFRQINDGLGMLRVNAATFSPDGSEIIVGTGGRGWYKASLTKESDDIEPPRATITAQPENLDAIRIEFTEPVVGFDVGELELTWSRQVIGLNGATLETSDNRVFTLRGVENLATETGQYFLRLDASESGIRDLAGNALAVDAAAGFWLDLEPPRVQIHVTFPDGVLSTTIGFTESVWGFDIDDLELTRDGHVIALEGVTLQPMGTNSIFRLFGLGGLATEPGEYVLRLDAATSGIEDFNGNAFVTGAETRFTIRDVTPPTVNVSDVRAGAVPDVIDFVFSESVQGFDLGDLRLTRNGEALDLAGATLQAMGESTFFELSGLRNLIDQAGEYRLELIASASGIADFAGNTLVQNAIEEFSIVGRTYDFNPQDRAPVVIAHRQALQLATGTIAFSFTADNAGGTLLSKDARGTANGDLQISYIRQSDSNRVRVQFVQGGRTHTLTSHSLQNGVQYNLELKFGQGGLRLFINGRLMGRNSGATGGLANQQDIVLGASNADSTRGTNDRFTSFFDGRIGGLTILDAAGELVFSDVAAH